jgi:hypothetical protein
LGHLAETREKWFHSGKILVEVGEVIPPQPDKSPEELTETLSRGVFGL